VPISRIRFFGIELFVIDSLQSLLSTARRAENSDEIAVNENMPQ